MRLERFRREFANEKNRGDSWRAYDAAKREPQSSPGRHGWTTTTDAHGWTFAHPPAPPKGEPDDVPKIPARGERPRHDTSPIEPRSAWTVIAEGPPIRSPRSL
jgi:hypothetical protein